MDAGLTRVGLFTARPLSGRRFPGGLVLVILAGLLAGCVPSAVAPSQAGVEAPAVVARASEPGAAKYGGTYRAMFGNDVPTLESAAPTRWQDWWASMFLLYNRLYSYDSDGQLVAELAAALPTVSEDGLVYTIPLRENVKFQNGETMTAQDVRFTFDRLFWPEHANAGFAGKIAGRDAVTRGESQELSGIEIVDEQTIRITLDERQAIFPALLTESNTGIVPQQAVEAAGADWGIKTAIGTGPFALVEWLPGDRIIFERHTDYFKPGLPYLDRVELHLNVPEEARVLRWENGEAEYVDYFDGVQAGELPRIQNDPELAPLVRMTPSTIFDFFQIASNVEPFTDVRVRQAIAMALDKQALAESTGIGASMPMDDIYTDLLPMYDPDFVSNYQYDPAAARQLLVEAGFADGIKGVDMYVDFHPYQGAIVQADLAKIGIEVNLLDGEPALYQDRIMSGEIPLVFTGFGTLIRDGSSFASWVLGCVGDAPPARALYCNDETQQLLGQANLLPLGDPQRNEIFQRIQEIVVNEAVYFIPVYRRNVLGLGQNYVKDERYSTGLPELESAYLEQ